METSRGRYHYLRVADGNTNDAIIKDVKVYCNTTPDSATPTYGWRSLGLRNSTSTDTIKVYKETEPPEGFVPTLPSTLPTLGGIFDSLLPEIHYYTFVRVTLNGTQKTRSVDPRASGSFKLLPASGFCYCPSSSAGSYAFNFECYVRKASNSAKTLFQCTNGSSYIKIRWMDWANNDGVIRVDNCYNGGTVAHIVSDNGSQGDSEEWHYVRVWADKGSTKCYIKFDAHKTAGQTLNKCFIMSDAVTTVGDTGLEFHGTLKAQGCKYKSSTHSVSINMSTASGTDKSTYSGVTHVETTEYYMDYE